MDTTWKSKRTKKKNVWNLVIWNVRGLFRVEALSNLSRELKRYNIMVAAIQETRWQGSEIFDTGDYMVCYSGSSDSNNLVIVSWPIRGLKIIRQILNLTLKGKLFNITIICVHAPTQITVRLKLIFFTMTQQSPIAPRPPLCQGFMITHRHTIVGRTSLDE
jgi:hypothetical protein